MPFVADPETSTGFFEPDEEKSLAGFGKNAWEDVKGTAKGLGNLAEGFEEHPVDTATNVIKGLPSAIMNEGKRVGAGELLTGHPINAVEKFGNAAYEKPLTTAMDVLPAAGAAGKALGLGGEAAEGADLAAQAAKAIPEAAAPAAAEEAGVIPFGRAVGNTVTEESPSLKFIGGEEQSAPRIKPEIIPSSPAPATGIIDDLKSYISPKIEAAKGAVNNAYAKQASRPGWAANVADYLQEKSQMMAAQDLGATPFQARQAGHEAMRAIGQYALDHDIVSPTNTLRGMRLRNGELLNEAGEKVGALRQQADKLRDPISNPVDVLQEVKARLDPKYAGALNSDEAGPYARALKAIEEAKPTHQGFADLATDLNQKANKAAKIQQPHGPFTDVANTVSQINNERIKQLLGPQKAAEYEQALRDFGANKKIESFLARKAGGEVKRLGPGSLTSNLVQKGLDEIGYKAGARALNRVSSSVLKNPEMAKSLPSMFKQFIHEVELPEPGGMAHGGVVGGDLNNFLASKYGNKKETR